MKFKAGDRIVVLGKPATVLAEGTLGKLQDYLKRRELPFRWDDYDYGDNERNCHSHIHINDIRHLTPLEEAME
jgi:hypothetical protein